jgi:mannose-1-phosphate guanylyltransferase/phosphomannomutase
MRYDRDQHAKAVANLVTASGASLGAVIDPDGENLTLVDDSGHVLTDDEALLAFVTLVARHLDGGAIALPLSATAHAERLAGQHGIEILRTKMSNAALMEAASRPNVGFAANTEGGFILPRFLPAFDGAAAMVRMLELLALDGTPLSKVVGSLPRVHIAHETVVTPWEQKGTVMRELVELSKDRRAPPGCPATRSPSPRGRRARRGCRRGPERSRRGSRRAPAARPPCPPGRRATRS